MNAAASVMVERIRANDSTLTYLDLSNNNIGDAGATALATALHTNISLTALSLYNNNIGDAGATALATALHTNTSLTTLDLRYNNIGAAGVNTLMIALQTNTILRLLRLGVSPVPVDLLPLLQRNQYLWRHQSWTYVRLTDFPVTCHTMVMSALLCGTAYPAPIPLRIWRIIFSFWEREAFFSEEPYYYND